MINECYIGDCRDGLRKMIAEGIKVQCCVTSPPYWALRDYGVAGQIGLEKTMPEFIAAIVEVFSLVREVLADDGVCWINLGDSYSGSWGAQSRPNGNDIGSTLRGGSMLSARQIAAAPKTTGTGSTKRTGLKPKDICGIPWRVAFALQDSGWWLRQDIIWAKPNPMPESVTDRCTKSHEYVFMLTKCAKYYYDADAIKEPAIYFDDDRKARAQDTHKSAPDSTRNGIRKYKVPSGWDTGQGSHDELTGRYPKSPVYKDARSYNGKHEDKQRGHGRRHAGFNDRWDEMTETEQCAMRNKRSVWTVATKPYSAAHFATFPPALIEPMIMATSRAGDIVLDPFLGSGTTAEVAQRLGRRWIGCDLNPAYTALQETRTRQMAMAI